jgi:hypothetical protein
MKNSQVICAASIVLIGCILSCSIPTFPPKFPSELVIKAEAALTVPLGKANFALMDYMPFDLGEGVEIFDYKKPSDSGQSFFQKRPPQTFLVHYKLPLEDQNFSFSDSKQMIDDLKRESTEIIDQAYPIPQLENANDKHPVIIDLSEAFEQIKKATTVDPITAYVPFSQLNSVVYYPEGIPPYTPPGANAPIEMPLGITLTGLEAVTFRTGKLTFEFILDAAEGWPGAIPGLSINDIIIVNPDNSDLIAGSSTQVNLANAKGSKDSSVIPLNNVTFPKEMELKCTLTFNNFPNPSEGVVKLTITPIFDKDNTVSGAKNLELNDDQIQSFTSKLGEAIDISGLPDSFHGTIGIGTLTLDCSAIFPAEDWEGISVDPSGLDIRQDPFPFHDVFGKPMTIDGLVIEGFTAEEDLTNEGLYKKNLHDKDLNSNSAKISGFIKASVPSKKLTFRNLEGTTVNAEVGVEVDIKVFSKITVDPAEFNLTLQQDIAPQDISDIEEMVDYIQFSQGVENDPEHGVGLCLKFDELEGLESMQMEVEVLSLGLVKVAKTLDKKLYQYPDKPANNNNIVFTNMDQQGYEFHPGYVDPDDEGKRWMNFGVNLVPELQEDKDYYSATGLLTLHNISADGEIKIKGTVSLVFDWERASVKPSEEDSNFSGSYPDLNNGEKGIDLSAVSGYKGLNFKEINAWLFLSCPLVKKVPLNPTLNFYARFGTVSPSGTGENLITEKGEVRVQVPKIIADPAVPDEDGEEPMAVYSGRIPENGYPLNLKDVLNDILAGTKTGELYFDYDISLLGAGQTGIVVTPDVFDEDGKLAVSVDILLELPLVFVAVEPTTEDLTRIVLKDINLGSGDFFGRSGPEDNSIFDTVSSIALEISLRNQSGISMGEVKLVNKLGTDDEFSIPILDLSKQDQIIVPDLEELKRVYPFAPQVVIEFPSGKSLQIDRGCSIGVNSISVKAGVEQTVKLPEM